MIIDKSAVDILKKYFTFDRIFNLLEYDHNMDTLYQELSKLTKTEFAPNYRFIFLHYDTEYYISNDMPGLTIINLQRILNQLNISNYFCLILTNQNIKEQLRQVKNSESTDIVSIDSITVYLHRPLYNTVDVELGINTNLITSKYNSLNRVCRFHRRVLVALLKYKNLLVHGVVSYYG